ncbi:MAG: hypothetical protein HN929_08460 [Chloroflexi bacterium]|jgi:hypothetical protein|nr:hypothetical protein [Chloroflexota bacterium]MBT7081482.1 hypothetical protein [Chloroflexota bacterium]MBT7289763.1 hypothetical protein [Chloroflexota bacterium]
MDKARLGGLLICLVVVVAAAAFIWGLFYSLSTWKYAIGIPVGAGVMVVCALGFWIGWTMLSTKVELPPPAEEEEEEEVASE